LDRNIRIDQYIPWIQSLHNKRSHGTIISNGNGRTVCYPAGQVANAISPPVQFWTYLWLEHSANCN